MVVFVSRRQIVAIRDKKVVIPGCEVVVSGMNENGEPMRSPCNVRAGYRLAISSAMTALTASRRVDPAGASLVGVALGEWTNHKKPAKGSGYCKFRFHRPVPRVNSPWCVSPSTQLPRSCDTPKWAPLWTASGATMTSIQPRQSRSTSKVRGMRTSPTRSRKPPTS